MRILSSNYWELEDTWAALVIAMVSGRSVIQMDVPLDRKDLFEDMFGTLHLVNNVVNWHLSRRHFETEDEKTEWAFNAFVSLLGIAFVLDNVDREEMTFQVHGWVPERAHLILEVN